MTRLLITLSAIAALTAAACSPGPGRSVDPVREAAIRARIDNRDFTIDMNRVIPNRMRSVSLTYPYNLRIKGDSLFSFLPYFGEAYTPLIGIHEGLIFDSTITGYKVTEGRKGSTEITFSTRTFQDRFDYRISVYSNGFSVINVYPDRKESIGFEGTVREPEKAGE